MGIKASKDKKYLAIPEDLIISFQGGNGLRLSGVELAVLNRYVSGIPIERIQTELGLTTDIMSKIQKDVKDKLFSV